MDGLPEVMTAVHLLGHGGLENLVVRHDVPVPKIKTGEVLVRVGACGMNNTDINTRVGWYSKNLNTDSLISKSDEIGGSGAWGSKGLFFPRIQGADLCGKVVATGTSVSSDLIGSRVLVDPCIRGSGNFLDFDQAKYLGSERDGGFAEYCAVPLLNVYLIKSPLTDIELASFPCSWSTAEYMLTRSNLSSGETVLVTGASGGVGTALIQLAKLRGAWVVAITQEEKAEMLVSLGVDQVINRNSEDLIGTIRKEVQQPVDVLADVVGGDGLSSLVEVVRRGGRLVTAGAIDGPLVELDLRTFYLNDLSFYGCTVYESSIFETLIGYIEKNKIRPVVAGTFSLEDIHKAQEVFLEKRHVGSFVLMPVQ